MDLIKTITPFTPLIGVFIGWFLSESGKIFTDKRQDKRKLKKLLYFLLELRHYFSRQLQFEKNFGNYIRVCKEKLHEKFNIPLDDLELNQQLIQLKSEVFKKMNHLNVDESKLNYLTENIEKMLIDLSEILPLLAFDLSSQSNVKDRLNKISKYFDSYKEEMESFPFDIFEWINPKVTNSLLENIDNCILIISKKINYKTLCDSKKTISSYNMVEDDSGINEYVEEYINKLSELSKNQPLT
ncbi:hypothetical protein GCM10027035_47690 [Emticicia sediminis]